LDVTGSGAVATQAQTCANHCVLQVAAGTVHLDAMAGSGWHFAAWSTACAAAACDVAVTSDLSLTATFAQDAAQPPAPIPSRKLSVTISGTGRVTSSPPGVDCPGACVASFDNGTSVLFTAAPGTGMKFDGWSGACGGMTCSVTVSSDAAVSATFEALPPVEHTLTVSTSGLGTVTSTPLGIQCPGICSAKFAEGMKLTLAAEAGSGMDFNGFSGACSGATCTVTLAADATVSAAFAAKPDPCKGLMPASIPLPKAVSVTLDPSTTGLACLAGTSDGLGNFALLSSSDVPSNSAEAAQLVGFYALTDFGAAQVNSLWTEGPQQLVLFGEPSGFAALQGNEPFSSSPTLWSFNHAGGFTSVIGLTNGGGDNRVSAAAGGDPAGCTVVVRNYPLSGAPNGFVVTWQRYDASGTPASLELQIGSGPNFMEAVSISPSGDALVVMNSMTGPGLVRLGIWVSRTGVTLSNWFTLSQQQVTLSALADGSQLLRRADGAPIGTVADGAVQVSAVPGWISARSGSAGPFIVRQGKAYAMFGTPQCPQMELLAPSGTSCGCVAVPEVSSLTTVGRDGSVIAPSGKGNGLVCHFQLYPRLLQ